MEEIIQLLKKINNNIDYATCDNLMSGKLLDSLQIVMLISAIEQKYNISLEPEMITTENFDSAQAIWKMIDGIKK